MAISNISNMVNSRVRMSGLASGLDIDGIVKQLMSAEKAKVDKVKQQRELAEWRSDAYRDVTSMLQGFNNEFFDLIKSSTNINSRNSYASYASTYSTTNASEYFTASGSIDCKAGTYEVKNIIAAKVASISSGTALTAGINGVHILDTDVANIKAANDNNKFKVVFNGVSKEIVLSDNPANITALKNDLESKLTTAFGAGKINVNLSTDATGGSLSFSTSDTNSFSIDYSYNSGAAVIFGQKLSEGLVPTAENNKFKIDFGGDEKIFSLTSGHNYSNTDAVVSAIQSMVDNSSTGYGAGKIRVLNQNGMVVLKAMGSTAVNATGGFAGVGITEPIIINGSNSGISVKLGTDSAKDINLSDGTYSKEEFLNEIQKKIDSAFGDNKVMVSIDGTNKLRFESISSTETVSTKSVENGGIAAIGMNDSNKSNSINLNANIYDIRNNFATGTFTPGTADSEGYDIKFKINGKEFKFKSHETSLKNIIDTVNSDTSIEVKMTYNSTSDKISLESKQTGVTAKVSVTEQSGNLMQIIDLKDKSDNGEDASITVNGKVVERSGNSFIYDGIQYNIKKDNTDETIKLNIITDSTKTFDMIKNFVSKYNDLISKINSKLSEKKEREYTPLTDDQKESMSEEQIKSWETKAKAGLLKNDSILYDLVTKMRTALNDSIEGLSTGLASIGITTSSYYGDKGKLVIDEQKLKAAISDHPDQVADLFAKESNYSYYDGLNSSSDRTKRYNQSGFGQRISDIIQDSIRTTRDKNGLKGNLLEKAGIVGDVTEFKSVLYTEIYEYDKRISELNDKLYDKETSYYNKFTAMEKAIAQMNSQSNWLSQQLGGN